MIRSRLALVTCTLLLILTACSSSPLSDNSISTGSAPEKTTPNPVKFWTQERWKYSQQGGTLEMPAVTSLQPGGSANNTIIISWNFVNEADQYHVGYGNTDEIYYDTHAEIPWLAIPALPTVILISISMPLTAKHLNTPMTAISILNSLPIR